MSMVPGIYSGYPNKVQIELLYISTAYSGEFISMTVDNNGSCPFISIGDLSGPSGTSMVFFPVIASMESLIASLISSMSYAPVGKCIACQSGYVVVSGVPSGLTLLLYENVKLLLGGLSLNGSDRTLGQL